MHWQEGLLITSKRGRRIGQGMIPGVVVDESSQGVTQEQEVIHS
jgi:hypothetical protein